MINNIIKNFTIISICAFLLSSCSWFEKNHDVIYTEIMSMSHKSPNADFSQYSTYSISNSILYVKGENDKQRISNELTQHIISTVEKNMNSLGYSKVDSSSDDPDLIVDLIYIVNTFTSTSYYQNYWWDWSYWWDWGGWDPFYPYYPYPVYPVSSSYSAGSLIVDIADVTSLDISTDNEIPVIWHGLARAILLEKHSMSERDAAIDKCFSILPPK